MFRRDVMVRWVLMGCARVVIWIARSAKKMHTFQIESFARAYGGDVMIVASNAVQEETLCEN